MWSGLSLGENAFFLQGADCLCRESHGDFLSINDKCLLLKVWLEDALGTAQAKAHVVSVHFAFTGDFTSCCHIVFPLQPFYSTFFYLFGQGVGAMLFTLY